jgi:predicted transcriptional regulator
MSTLFSETLSRFREDSGFRTAYQFYHKCGGQQAFNLTYRNYLKIENGTSLPQADKLKTFIKLLPNLRKNSKETEELVTAWLKSSLGGENFDFLIAPLISQKNDQTSLPLMQEALKKSLVKNTYPVSIKEMAVIVKTPANYFCNIVLSNDTGTWTKEQLAKTLNMDEKAISQALKDLIKIHFVKETKKDNFTHMHIGKSLECSSYHTLPENVKTIYNNKDKFIADMENNGKHIFSRRGILRVDEKAFNAFINLLKENIDIAKAYNITRKTQNSACIMLEAHITKLFQF